jgi:competence protein ComEA
MWSSFTKDEKKLFIFLLLLLAIGAVVFPYLESRRKTEIFTAQSAAGEKAKKPPRQGNPTRQGNGNNRADSSGGLLDINTASEAELVKLPGIGPTRAAAIVAYRESHGPFQSVDDLAKVHGIGKATMRALEGFVTVADEQNETSSPRTSSSRQRPPTIGFTPSPAEVPHVPAAVVSGTPAVASPPKVLNLNTATVEELAALEQIGPVLARRIVDYRTQNGRFHSLEELDKVPGIGKKRIELNRHVLTVY